MFWLQQQCGIQPSMSPCASIFSTSEVCEAQLYEMAHVRVQSAVLGFGVFRVLERYGVTSGLSIGENVILQTTSVATATMPLAAGKEAPRA